jgi:hypothetical protein
MSSVHKALFVLAFSLLGWFIMSTTLVADADGHKQAFRFHHERMDGASKFRLLRTDNSAASYSDTLELLESPDSTFRELLTAVLWEQQHAVPAYFWECSPFSQSTLNDISFEFVILPAPVLLTRHPDSESFSEKFNSADGSGAVAFRSLRGDAMLIAPVPQERTSEEAYMHLAAFVYSADTHQINAFWLKVASSIRKQLKTTPEKIWLSTSGAGVQWLHVRLDSRPKYYNWQEYK